MSPSFLAWFHYSLKAWSHWKASPGKSVINRFVDPWIGAPQIEPPDPDIFCQRFRGHRYSVSGRKPVLQKIHPFDNMSHVFGHRTDCIQMFWFNRKYAF